MRNVIPAMGMLLALSGCDLPALPTLAVLPSTYHPVSYYDANPLARDQANAWCHNNPGLAVKYPSCDSADISGIHDFNHKMGWK